MNHALTAPKILAAAVIGWSAWQAAAVYADRHAIHPFTAVGWQREQFSICFFLAVAGGLVMKTSLHTDREPRVKLYAVLSLAVLALVCASIFLRYFWISSAIFGVIANALAALLSPGLTQRQIVRYPLAAFLLTAFLLFAAFVSYSFLSAGS